MPRKPIAQVVASALGSARPAHLARTTGAPPVPPTPRSRIELRVAGRPVATSITAPGDLGLARAYVTGDLEIEGDLYAALIDAVERPASASCRGRSALDVRAQPRPRRLRWVDAAARGVGARRCATAAGTPRPATPTAISHHYDVSNTFYSWVLGPSMAYTCAVLPEGRRDARGGAGREVRPGLPQARPAARHAAARRRLRLGRHGPARREALRRARRSASRCRASRPSGARRRSPRTA